MNDIEELQNQRAERFYRSVCDDKQKKIYPFYLL